MGKRKTDEERADEQRRYALAREASSDCEFESFLSDPNQAIRNAAAMNPNASAHVLDQFASDKFWSVRVTVATHRNTSLSTLFRLLEHDHRRRGVVHHETRRRLEAEGIQFDGDGLPCGSGGAQLPMSGLE